MCRMVTDTPADGYELVIGLETHVQLATASKMFCACAASSAEAEPNSLCCPTCLGLPGALPTVNGQAVALAVRLGLALGGTVHGSTLFERKNYFYPDLPKGYQISQYRRPLCTGGALPLGPAAAGREVRIERLHLEEDTGKLEHGARSSLIDFNRSGLPLVEIVTRPDLRAPDEAALYVETLRQLLRWLGVSTGRMADGALRVDVNCSLRPAGSETLGTKVELKNLNSIAAVRDALAYERVRQARLLAAGESIRHETRGWLEDAGRTVSQRGKEQAADYRYFPEPDLPPLVLPAGLVEAARAALPELPWRRQARFEAQLGLRPDEARLLTRNAPTADYFERALDGWPGAPRTLAGWLVGPFFALLNAAGLEVEAAARRLPPDALAELAGLVEARRINASTGKDLLARMLAGGERAAAIVAREGLAQVDDRRQLAGWVDEALAANPKAVADWRAGKAGVLGFLVGAVMKASRGQAAAAEVKALMEAALASEVAGTDATVP